MFKPLLMGAAVLTLMSTASAEAPSVAESLIAETSQQAITYMEDGALTKSEANDLLAAVNVDLIARFALGKHARRVSDADYDAYRAAFERYLVGQLQTHLSTFSQAEFEVTDVVPRNARDVIVKTEVVGANGEGTPVSWRVRRAAEGWKVIDVQTMGMWLAIEQRAQFAATLDRHNGRVAVLTKTLQN